jgi:hypothetical protein
MHIIIGLIFCMATFTAVVIYEVMSLFRDRSL